MCCRCDAEVSKAATDVFGTAQKYKKQNKTKQNTVLQPKKCGNKPQEAKTMFGLYKKSERSHLLSHF